MSSENPIHDEVKSRGVHDIDYWMLDDDYLRVASQFE